MPIPPRDTAHRPKSSAVPGSSLARLAGLGGLAAGIGGRLAVGAARQVASGQKPKLADLLLTPTNARKVTQQLSQLRGAALKVGQLISMDTGDFLPRELAQIFAQLRADADHMPPQQLRRVLDAAWGKGWITRFARFDVRPIASASIGQVHRAQTKDGRDLAIKVQYPGVRRSIDADVSNVATLLRLSGMVPAALDMVPFLAQARAQLHEEADYTREAAQLVQFGSLLATKAAFVVPKLHADLSGPDVLAMDFIDSHPIEDMETAPQSDRDQIITDLLRLIMDEFFHFNLMQTDPNFANFRYAPATRKIVLLDFGATRSFAPDLAPKFRAMLAAHDTAAIDHAARAIGYFDHATAPHMQSTLVDMMAMALTPLQSDQPFDFATTDLLHRLRDRGLSLGTGGDFAHIPPMEVLYLHRKAAGLFLLAHRLRARIPLSPLLAAYQ
jgi:predicted unusual protein kinase regulating ubiquinone biosynthesis (AarF/ABC1/UbiB family)